jgi:hypothetical protein
LHLNRARACDGLARFDEAHHFANFQFAGRILTMKAIRQLYVLRLPILGILLISSTTAMSAPTGPTQTGEICLQKIFGTPVTQSKLLNCTAGDISLSQVISVVPNECVQGSTVDLEATFEVDVTANGRYDPGFLFRTDGGANARGTGLNADGVCSLSALTPPQPPNAPALQLDGDTCGDLNSGTFQVTFVIPDVECSDTDGNGKLNLPYCTSWHSNQGTACDIAEPFDFDPDTKSKCVCDDNFEVPVTVEDAELTVEKSAAPTQVPEPGGEVTYTVTIENIAKFESVIIETIDDDIFGNLADAGNPDVTDNTCVDLVGDTLLPETDTTCTFKAQIAGNAGDNHLNEVGVCASQPPSTDPTVCGYDDATVDITDEFDEPTLVKSVQATANCQVDVNYQVVVSNNSDFDILTVDALNDVPFGDITTVQGDVVATDCSVPHDIDPLDNYTCNFTGRIVEEDCDVSHDNVVTADTTDDDGVTSQPSGDATVTLSTSY